MHTILLSDDFNSVPEFIQLYAASISTPRKYLRLYY